MSKSSAGPAIRLRGVRHNNLKDFDVDLPLNRLLVITGLSGSGKSSFAFDTLFAEGQRRYIETFSPYARQFFDRMDKPRVDSIEGIPPAIAIEQRNAVRTTRSTVGTMTEICDYMKLVWRHLSRLRCRQCGRLVGKDSPHQIWEAIHTHPSSAAPYSDQPTDAGQAPSEVLISFDLPLSDKIPLDECLALVAKQGYQRVLVGNVPTRIEEASAWLREAHATSLTVVQDRLSLKLSNRARFAEACEQAYHFGKGKLSIHSVSSHPPGGPTSSSPRSLFSNRLHCATCDIEYREPSPALFSFNHPVGACPTCRGFGRTISIDLGLAVPDRTRTLAQGVVKPWLSGTGAECQQDMRKFCRILGVPMDVPFNQLDPKWQDWVINGEPGYGTNPDQEWPKAWYGVKGYFRWLESKAYKMHVRVLLSRYRSYQPCAVCKGKRFQPDALLFKVAAPARLGVSSAPDSEITLADFYNLSIRDALRFIESIQRPKSVRDPFAIILDEVRSRLGYLVEVGLGYLTLDRPTRTLSGGETERVNLTTCLGARLVNTLFVLDEPSVGLHPRDTARLVGILERLRDAGNTVVVVEHEASVMRAADQILDLGPGHGETGGQLVFQGPFRDLLKCPASLTGGYLSGRRRIETPRRRAVRSVEIGSPLSTITKHAKHGTSRLEDSDPSREREANRNPWVCPALLVEHATHHNLQDLSVRIPLGRLVCITGVSGSGKTTLVRDILVPTVEASLKSTSAPTAASVRADTAEVDESEDDESSAESKSSASVTGSEHLSRLLMVDQSSLGKTPRSNPAVYIGAFEAIRDLFAQSEAAQQLGLNSSSFSFNSPQGQCERCRGAGFEKIEMQFLSDVFVRCPDCDGRRYREHILQVAISPISTDQAPGPSPAPKVGSHGPVPVPKAWTIADMLNATVDDAIDFLGSFSQSRTASKAVAALAVLQEIGLGYLRLGQPINSLSGGESQRLKLAGHLVETLPTDPRPGSTRKPSAKAKGATQAVGKPILFIFDEPTTGLHFDDVRLLLLVFQRLVDAGHSVLVIEHNMDVIKCADWVIDLGPDAGDQGGRVVATGTPEEIAACAESHTGTALRGLAG